MEQIINAVLGKDDTSSHTVWGSMRFRAQVPHSTRAYDAIKIDEGDIRLINGDLYLVNGTATINNLIVTGNFSVTHVGVINISQIGDYDDGDTLEVNADTAFNIGATENITITDADAKTAAKNILGITAGGSTTRLLRGLYLDSNVAMNDPLAEFHGSEVDTDGMVLGEIRPTGYYFDAYKADMNLAAATGGAPIAGDALERYIIGYNIEGAPTIGPNAAAGTTTLLAFNGDFSFGNITNEYAILSKMTAMGVASGATNIYGSMVDSSGLTIDNATNRFEGFYANLTGMTVTRIQDGNMLNANRADMGIIAATGGAPVAGDALVRVFSGYGVFGSPGIGPNAAAGYTEFAGFIADLTITGCTNEFVSGSKTVLAGAVTGATTVYGNNIALNGVTMNNAAASCYVLNIEMPAITAAAIVSGMAVSAPNYGAAVTLQIGVAITTLDQAERVCGDLYDPTGLLLAGGGSTSLYLKKRYQTGAVASGIFLDIDQANNVSNNITGMFVTHDVSSMQNVTYVHEGSLIDYNASITANFGGAGATARRVTNYVIDLSNTLTAVQAGDLASMEVGFLNMAVTSVAGAGIVNLSGTMRGLSLGDNIRVLTNATALVGDKIGGTLTANDDASSIIGYDAEFGSITLTRYATLYGQQIVMPASYTAATTTGTGAAQHMTGDGMVLDTLYRTGAGGDQMVQRIVLAPTGYGINITADAVAGVANATTPIWMSHDITQTANATIAHTGIGFDYNAYIQANNGGGAAIASKDQAVFDAIVTLDAVLATDIARMTAGFSSRQVISVAGAGVTNLYGDMDHISLGDNARVTVPTAQTLRGFYVNGTLTLDGATAVLTGYEADMSAVVMTDFDALTGLKLVMPAAYPALAGSFVSALSMTGGGVTMSALYQNGAAAIIPLFISGANGAALDYAIRTTAPGVGGFTAHFAPNLNAGTLKTEQATSITDAGRTGGYVNQAVLTAGAFAADTYLDSYTVTGTLAAAFAVRGFHLASNLTLNNASAVHYGSDINLDGVIVTLASQVIGSIVDMSGATTLENAAYAAGKLILMPDGTAPALDLSNRGQSSGRLEIGAPYYHCEFGRRIWSPEWVTDGVNNAGDETQAPGSDINGRVHARTNALAGAVFERNFNDIFEYDSAYHTVWEGYVVASGTVNTDTQVRFGLIDAAETTFAELYVDVNADTSIHLRSSAAGAGTLDADTGIDWLAGHYYYVRVEMRNNAVAGGLIIYLRDETAATAFTAPTTAVNQIPAGGVAMQPSLRLTSRVGGGGTRTEIDVDNMGTWQDRVRA